MASVKSCENAQNFKHAQFIISCTVPLWVTYISFQAEILQSIEHQNELCQKFNRHIIIPDYSFSVFINQIKPITIYSYVDSRVNVEKLNFYGIFVH